MPRVAWQCWHCRGSVSFMTFSTGLAKMTQWKTMLTHKEVVINNGIIHGRRGKQFNEVKAIMTSAYEVGVVPQFEGNRNYCCETSVSDQPRVSSKQYSSMWWDELIFLIILKLQWQTTLSTFISIFFITGKLAADTCTSQAMPSIYTQITVLVFQVFLAALDAQTLNVWG